jgi:uncharacterized protein (TIRG00374 family)
MSKLVEQKKRKITWGLILRLFITFGILGYLATKVNWPELSTQFKHADLKWIVAATGIMGFVMIGVSIRWWLLLKVQEIHIKLYTVFVLNLIGQFFNAFLLGSTGGDVIRLFYIIQYAPEQKARAALSILVDRVIGLFILILLAVLVLPWQIEYLSQHEQIRHVSWMLVYIFCLGIVGMIFLAFFPFHEIPLFVKRLWGKIPKRDFIETLFYGYKDHLKHPNFCLGAFTTAIGVHFMSFLSAYCIAMALNLNVNFLQMIVIIAIVFCLISLPISLSGHGVRELAFVQMFTLYGIISINQTGKEQAIAFSIILFGTQLFWSLVGGLFYLTYHHHEKRHRLHIPT